MATIAGILDRFTLAKGYDAAHSGSPDPGQPFRIREVANGQNYFFVKRIDNSRIVRQADPRAGTVCWRSIGAAFTGAVVLVALSLPMLYGMLEGGKIESLRQERQRLLSERSVLELREARLLSPDRLERLALKQRLVDPDPRKIVYLPAKADGTLAQSIPGADAAQPVAPAGASN